MGFGNTQDLARICGNVVERDIALFLLSFSLVGSMRLSTGLCNVRNLANGPAFAWAAFFFL